MKKVCYMMIAVIAVSFVVLTVGAVESKIVLPGSTKIINDEAFFGDTSIEKVIVPEGTIVIGKKAFAGSTLKEIELPATFASIAEDAFADCGEITAIVEAGSYVETYAQEYLMQIVMIPQLNITEDGTITGYVGAISGDIIIPETVSGIRVKAINDDIQGNPYHYATRDDFEQKMNSIANGSINMLTAQTQGISLEEFLYKDLLKMTLDTTISYYKGLL